MIVGSPEFLDGSESADWGNVFDVLIKQFH